MNSDIKTKVLDAVEPSNKKNDSLWRRNVRSIGMSHENIQNCFGGSITCKLGDGRAIDFWKDSHGFSVKSRYVCFSELNYAVRMVEDNILKELEILWIYNIPSKTHVFGWKLLLNKLP